MSSKDMKELQFERSDGDGALWPSNTKRLVDSEGHVNYMHPVDLKDDWSIRWRRTIASNVAILMNLPADPQYVFRDWPGGYRMFIHHKGPQANPRTDKYLIGSKNVARFRSIPEFIPHALWLMTDPSLTRSNCGCKYCGKKPQRNITESLGLSTASDSARDFRHSVLHPPIKRERGPPVVGDISAKLYASIRRTPNPVKMSTGPKQSVTKERSSDLRALSVALKRQFREGEVLWCALTPPIRSRDQNEEANIVFWPGIVRGFRLGHETVPVSAYTKPSVDTDIVMDGSGSSVSTSPITPINSKDAPWKVRQWIIYKVALLAIPHTYDICDYQVIPYQAYEPSPVLLEALRSELTISGLPEGESSFVPCPSLLSKPLEQNQSHEMEVDTNSADRFRAAAAPFCIAFQIAACLTSYWTATDAWEFKFTPPPTVPHFAQGQTLDSAISSSLSGKGEGSLPGHVTGPVGNAAQDRLGAQTNRLSGSHLAVTSALQSFTQKRYQGLWWGTERLWTDDLVRLKVARRHVAPDGGEHIFSPAGPSKSTLEAAAATVQDPDISTLGAGERGLFMKMESLFAVDLPQEDGRRMHELRASGMLYELVDADWEEDEIEIELLANGKGKERADEEIGFVFNGIGEPSSFRSVNLDYTLQRPPIKKARLESQSDPSLSITTTSKALPDAGQPSKTRSPNLQLSNPGMNCPLPEPPEGFKFRPILPHGREAVVSLTMISGRYYPRLLSSPCMRPYLEKAFNVPLDPTALGKYHHMWALEGLSPGFHNSVDPSIWKRSHQEMMLAADQEAKALTDSYFQQQKNGVEGLQGDDNGMNGGDMDVDLLESGVNS